MANNLQEFEEQLQQEAIARQEEQDWESDPSQYYQDPDGTYYKYDHSRKAWIPMITDDFIAQYNMSYGAYDASAAAAAASSSSSSAASHAVSEGHATAPMQTAPHNVTADAKPGEQQATDTKSSEPQDGTKKKRPAPEPAWFDIQDEKNSNVYVTGLPPDITEQEYLELMTKVGLVACDPVTRKLKLKLYTNADGSYKGDGRCCYLKPESVQLALSILDGSNVRGYTISVERAKFELKGQYDPTKKKRKLTKQEKKKAEEKEKWLLGWEPEKKTDGRPHYEKTVVIKNAFTPKQFEESPDLLLELTDDFREECKKFGDVKKVLVCDRHEEGVVLVTFKFPEQADECIQAVNRRWFGGRQLDASTYDGRTKYYVRETDEEKSARMKKWGEFLQGSKSSDNVAQLAENKDGEIACSSKNSVEGSEQSAVDSGNGGGSSTVTSGVSEIIQDNKCDDKDDSAESEVH